MRTAIEQIVESRHPVNVDETKAVLREIMQSVVLVGLSRSGFFEKASFYGETALRIFYHLNRYSEDLDFTLNDVNEGFSLQPYLCEISHLATSYGLELEMTAKNKAIESPIESAFAKLNTYQTFITLKVNPRIVRFLHKDEVVKVKLEVDSHPALGFKAESRWLDMPEFAPVIVLDEPSLFSGKIQAILCRNFKNNVKGRDYYDFLFFMQRRIRPNMEYLRNKLLANGKISEADPFDMDTLKKMLKEQFEKVDFSRVRQDAMRFTFENEDLSYYSKELFMQMADRL